LELRVRLRHQDLAVQEQLARAEREVLRGEAEVPLRGGDVKRGRRSWDRDLDDEPVFLHGLGSSENGLRTRADLPACSAGNSIGSAESPAAQDLDGGSRNRDRAVPDGRRSVPDAKNDQVGLGGRDGRRGCVQGCARVEEPPGDEPAHGPSMPARTR